MKLTEFRQTIFITKDGYNKVTLIFDEVQDGATVEILGRKISVRDTCTDMLIPSVSNETIAAVILYLPDGSTISYTEKLKVIKKWNISFIDSSHVVMGESDYINRIQEGCSKITDIASDIINEFPDYKYTIENGFWLDGIDTYGSEWKNSTLRRLIENGNIEINAPYCISHTHLQGYEQLPRTLYFSESIKSKWGYKPDTMMLTDISGISQAAVTAYSNAGIKYVILTQNPFRSSNDDSLMPQLFWLSSPNGKDRVLVFIQKNSFTESYVPGDGSYNAKNEYLNCRIALNKTDTLSIENKLDAMTENFDKVDMLPIVCFKERSLPNIMIKALSDAMQAKWEYPKFSVSTPSTCMKYIDENFCDDIPVFYGDMNDQFEDDITISPKAVAIKRESEKLFSIAESVSLIKAMEKQDNKYPKSALISAFRNIREFDEQCRGTTLKSKIEMNRFNYIHAKDHGINLAYNAICDILKKQAESKTDKFITAFNTVPYQRKVSLITDKPLDKIICRKLSDGKYLTEPVQLPAFGTKSFVVAENFSEQSDFAMVSSTTINTALYTITYDNRSGAITSIIETATMRELIDRTCPYALGDFIYVTSEKDDNKTELNVQKTISVSVENSSLYVSIIREGFEEQSGAKLKSVITFYRYSKNIDIRLEFKEASTLIGDFSDRYRKNIFYAIPLKCENYHYLTELAGGVVNESTDRLPIGNRDFTVTQDWIAVENETFGTAVFTKEMPVFHLGKIKYNNFSSQYNCTSPNIYLYAASNRANQLTYLDIEDCSGIFNLSLLPYRCPWSDIIPHEAMNFIYKPMTYDGYTIERSWLSLSAKGIKMTAFKKAEDENGLIIRFMEVKGETKNVTLTLPCKIRKVYYTNITENNTIENSDFSENTVNFDINKYSYTTLRIIPERDYEIQNDDENDNQIQNFYSYFGHCKRNVVVWTKKSWESDCKYDIICDGKTIVTVDNQPYLTQLYMTDIYGKHDFEVKISDK